MSRSACTELVEYSVSVSLTHLSMDVETGISVGERERERQRERVRENELGWEREDSGRVERREEKRRVECT